MITRIVKMKFKEESISAFLEVFYASKPIIETFSGCKKVELFREESNKCCFMTYSHWDTSQSLDNYRNSDFFKTVWAKTKVLFRDKAEAISLQEI